MTPTPEDLLRWQPTVNKITDLMGSCGLSVEEGENLLMYVAGFSLGMRGVGALDRVSPMLDAMMFGVDAGMMGHQILHKGSN